MELINYIGRSKLNQEKFLLIHVLYSLQSKEEITQDYVTWTILNFMFVVDEARREC